MKISATIGIMTLMTLGVQPGESRQKAMPTKATVTVCVESTVQTGLAESVTSQIFANAGFRIDWRHKGRCPADGIVVTLVLDTPASLLPGSLAYSLPFEGSHIRVFYDRIMSAQAVTRLLAPKILGHVFAHEIGHILQGGDQHSETGVMKAHWTEADYSAMTFEPLRFTPIDIDLIERGLAKRAAAFK
jgi:hypothetical protein